MSHPHTPEISEAALAKTKGLADRLNRHQVDSVSFLLRALPMLQGRPDETGGYEPNA